ncbi:MAG: hypothetical protein HY551_06540, partial [Elusimicrobia bacterium]|nr:hypothetical protein [Elusimicrobiota bacterium]
GSLVAATRSARRPAGGASRPAAIAAGIRWAPAVLAAGVLALLSRMAWADFNAGRGLRARREGRPREAAAHLERAVALNGWSASYRSNLANLLWDGAETETENRRILLARAAEIAWEGVRRHPADSMSYWLLGRAELRRCRWGGEAGRLEPARLALEAAAGMNPFFGPIRQDLDDAMKGAQR